MTQRIDITFDSGNVTGAGYLYLPDPVSGTVPCVVMAHGFSGTNPHDKAIIDVQAAKAPQWRNAVAARMLFR